MKFNVTLILLAGLFSGGCWKAEESGSPSPVAPSVASAPVADSQADPAVAEPAGLQPAEAAVQASSKVRYYEVPGCHFCVNIKAAMTDLEEEIGDEVEFEVVAASIETLQEMKQWQLGNHGLVGFSPTGDSKVTIPGHDWGATREGARTAVEQRVNELLGKSEPGPIPPEVFEGGTSGHSHGGHEHEHKPAVVAARAIPGQQGPPTSQTVQSCAACHGESGEGQRENLAPSLAGMPEWYLNKQVSRFIDGSRRPLPGKEHGDAMVTLLKGTEAAELERVSAYYSKLPAIRIEANVEGDATRGQNIYSGMGACVNCHLANGQGGESSGAPPITIIPEWYFLRQMKAFREGDRAAHIEDEIVQCMVVAASRLDEEQCKDVSAYLAELAKRQ